MTYSHGLFHRFQPKPGRFRARAESRVTARSAGPFQPSPSAKHAKTPNQIDGAQALRVTHKFHPLYGHEFTLVERRTTWNEDRVYFFDDTGRLRRIPTGWTSVAPANAFVEISAGRSHFRTEDLLQLAVVMAQVRAAQGPTKSRRRRATL